MDLPKLTKKHPTFDCGLTQSEYHNNNQQNQTILRQNQTNEHPSNQLTSSNNTNNNINNNNNGDLVDVDDDDDQFDPTDNNNHQQTNLQSNRLSKLTLSSSLHQLNDSKYLTNNNQPNAQHLNQQPTMNPNEQTNLLAQNQTQQTHLNNKTKREANLDTVHVVVGNESCDLDSAVSCLLMFHIISKMSDEINGKDKSRTLYIPLLNTTRDLLDSKSEVLWFLQKTLNIDKSFLTCKDDIDWTEIKRNGIEVLITLVDHNYNDQFKDIGRIVEIIDHHQVQNPQWLMENHPGIRLTIDTSVGSCATLVAERLFYIYAEHHVSDEILMLIYGTLLLDTICLSEKAKRFTRRDIYLLKKLDALLGSKRPNREELYKQLVEVKNSTRGELNFEKLMKRDLKVYKDKHGMRIGIASLFGMAAKEALGLAANIDLDSFFGHNQYEAFIIMGLIADLEQSDSISRDLVLISANTNLFEQLCKTFEADSSKLDLVPISTESSRDPEDNFISGNQKRSLDSSAATSGSESKSKLQYRARMWLQRNVSSSRKVVAPLVLKVLHDGA